MDASAYRVAVEVLWRSKVDQQDEDCARHYVTIQHAIGRGLTHYELLLLSMEDARDRSLRNKAFKKLALVFHPDQAARRHCPIAVADFLFRELSVAKNVLDDDWQRRRYEEERRRYEEVEKKKKTKKRSPTLDKKPSKPMPKEKDKPKEKPEQPPHHSQWSPPPPPQQRPFFWGRVYDASLGSADYSTFVSHDGKKLFFALRSKLTPGTILEIVIKTVRMNKVIALFLCRLLPCLEFGEFLCFF